MKPKHVWMVVNKRTGWPALGEYYATKKEAQKNAKYFLGFSVDEYVVVKYREVGK
jgi:hypothetical protein